MVTESPEDLNVVHITSIHSQIVSTVLVSVRDDSFSSCSCDSCCDDVVVVVVDVVVDDVDVDDVVDVVRLFCSGVVAGRSPKSSWFVLEMMTTSKTLMMILDPMAVLESCG